MTIDFFSGCYTNDTIECDSDIAVIARSVHENGVALLTGVFEAGPLVRLRKAVFDWSLRTRPEIGSHRSFHRVDHLPAKSKTPHIFHAFNLYLRSGGIDPSLDDVVRPFFAAMKGFQNALTGNAAGFVPDDNGRFLRPQVLQYPSGGGFFGRHVHPYLPQRIGLIVGLSRRGQDFSSGGTWFEFDNETIDIEHCHEIGDIALFRYDIPHGIAPIDDDRELDWHSERGRWTMVLPYY